MKKLFALLLALCMVFALCACGQQAASQPEETKAPELAPRKQQIFEEGDIDAFAAAVAEALK